MSEKQIYGPYSDDDKWRVILLSETGQRITKTLPSLTEAEDFIRSLERQVEAMHVPRTLGDAQA